MEFIKIFSVFLLFVLVGSGCSSIEVNKNNTKTFNSKISTNSQSLNSDKKTENKKGVNSDKYNIEKKVDKNLYKVLKVVDGDTIVVSYKGNRETLRLIGIDTPETKHPDKPVQCFGNKASQKMKNLVSGKQVKLVKDKNNSNRDKYNRLLRHVYLSDGTFVNAEMVRQGYAYAYLQFSFEYTEKFRKLEQQARQNKRGLWAENTCDGEKYPNEDDNRSKDSTVQTNIKMTPTSTKYNCSKNKYNCSDFETHKKAQKVFQACGGVDNDVHRLDMEGDGKACESLP